VSRGGQVLLGVTTFVLAVVAVLLALVGAFLTPDKPHVWVIPVPVGVLIAVLGNLILGIGGAWGTQTRFAPAVTGFVWLVVAFILGSNGPGGDEIVSGRGWLGVAYLFLGAIAAAVAIGVGPNGLQRRPPASSLGADLRR
jgi:hypothetical protein